MKTRCPFLQFMPQKPDKFGAKFWVLADAESRYVFNAVPYLGRDTSEDRQGMQLGEYAVMTLLEPYFQGGYNVTTDNFFTSLQLAEQLLRRNITLVGTMKKSRKEPPKELLDDKKRAVQTAVSMRHATLKVILFSFKAKKSESVILLSSLHFDAAMDGQ